MKEDTSTSLFPATGRGLRQELVTLASLVIVETTVAVDPCWQEHLICTYVPQLYEGPGRSQSPPPQITYKGSLVYHSNCHLEVQPSLAQRLGSQGGGRAENGQEHD